MSIATLETFHFIDSLVMKLIRCLLFAQGVRLVDPQEKILHALCMYIVSFSITKLQLYTAIYVHFKPCLLVLTKWCTRLHYL